MKYIYSLRINIENVTNGNEISSILDVVESKIDKCYWELEKIENEIDPYIDYIGFFLDLLENKLDALEIIGVKKEDITIWLLYEYDDQCNLEFTPNQMKRIGDNGITFCISCWETGGYISLDV